MKILLFVLYRRKISCLFHPQSISSNVTFLIRLFLINLSKIANPHSLLNSLFIFPAWHISSILYNLLLIFYLPLLKCKFYRAGIVFCLFFFPVLCWNPRPSGGLGTELVSINTWWMNEWTAECTGEVVLNICSIQNLSTPLYQSNSVHIDTMHRSWSGRR